MINDVRKTALIRLMDDDSAIVREAMIGELKEHGPEGIAFLKELAVTKENGLDRHARKLLSQLGADDPVGDFKKFVRSFHYELETGCFLLERTIHPELEWEQVARFLDSVALRCSEFIDDDSTTFEKCKQLNLVLFHEYGFRGDSDNFHDPENNFLSSVIRRRKGIPISLSAIYYLVADRCKFHLDPVGIPGRFLLASFDGSNTFYLDPFDRGRFRSEEEVRQILLSKNIEDSAEYLLPTPVGEILCRFCRNLVHQYTMKNELQRAHQFASFIQEFENAYERESST